MKHANIGANAPLALSDQSCANSAPAHPGRHDGWTRARQATFLRALCATQSVAQAARMAGMSRQKAYALRARLKGEPFDLAWHAALRCRFDALAEAAMERALNGVEVPHFHKGELIHVSRRFDERLTVALLAMRDRLGPPRPRSNQPAFAYGPEDFGALVARVERGPETFDEEVREAYEDYYEHYAPDAEDDAAEEGSDETPHSGPLPGNLSPSKKEYFPYGKEDFGEYDGG